MKNTIKSLDKLLGGRLFFLYSKIQYLLVVSNIIFNRQRHIICYYDKDKTNTFSILCDTYGSDKGSAGQASNAYTWKPHTYADLYSLLFDHCRTHVKKVFECGIGTNQPDLPSSMTATGKPGASLRVWRDYFPNALVVGADIDRSILFNEERITTDYIDQTKPEIIRSFWSKLNLNNFDLMIDDGLHTFDSSITLFENSIVNLSRQGIYIIEDVAINDLKRYKNYFGAKSHYQVNYLSLLRSKQKLANNNLVMVKFVSN